MITVTIWHNVAVDGQGHHTGMLDGYQPGDPVVRVFTYQATPASSPEEIAEEAFAASATATPATPAAKIWPAATTSASCGHSVGDVVAVGEAGLAVGRVGWTLVPGGLNEVRVSEHGTRPCPRRPATGRRPANPRSIHPGRSRNGHDCP
jgi:hypothetical protein